jgi:hypothetical protein
MRYFALENLSSLNVAECDPPSMQDLAYYPPTKNEFRVWCHQKSTKWCFFSAVEAIDPHGRVTMHNPPFKMWGLVVDFDAVVEQGMIDLIAENGASGLLPRWTSRTYSGKRRVVWEFERPVLVDNEEITDRFLSMLAKELNIRNILPNPDPASYKRSQYFERGREWQEIPGHNPVPTTLLEFLFVKAATAQQIKSDGPEIPIERIGAEAEARFPGRWQGEFVEGARGPLFWISDGIDRVGCQVGKYGMICYSDRAGKSFVTWREIFGREFVRNYEAERVGAAAEGLWFDNRHYWRKDASGVWKHRTKEDTIMWLKNQGISASSSVRGLASDAEKVLLAAQELRDVKAAAPIVHDAREMVVINGEKYLNISTCKVLEPAEHGEPVDFPWLSTFFNNVWDAEHAEQQDYFLAWFQHFYVSALNGTPQQGQAVFIAGEPSRGKTFLNLRILGPAMGGCSDPTEFLMERTSFNRENVEVAVWAVDDSRGGSSWEKHAAFSAAIKKHIANPQVRCEGKFANAFTIPWNGRIVVTCNTDKESLNILPTASDSILDKVMMFKWGAWQAEFLPNKGTEAVVAKELPYFLSWLQRWQAPANVLSANPRYKVTPYHHPDLLRASQDASPAARLRELIDDWRENLSEELQSKPAWFTPTKLRKMLSVEPGARDSLREFGRDRLAAAMDNLGEGYVIRTRRNGRSTEYLLDLTPQAKN